MPAKSKPKRAAPVDTILTDMREFHSSVDWAEWWEEFYTAITPGGTPLYKTFRKFASAKASNQAQRNFIEYLIGPPDLFEQVPSLWLKWKPMDWEEKRATGGWYSDKSIQALSTVIKDQRDAINALRASGNQITLRSLVRFESLAQQLDKEFRGRFFVEGLSYADNLSRANSYLHLHRQIQILQQSAQDMFAKAHGINYAVDGFQTLLMGMKAAAQETDVTSTRTGKMMSKIIEMTLSKAATHDIPVPEPMETAIVEINRRSKLN